MKNEEYNKYSNPIEYLKIIFRRKWLLIIPASIGLLFGVIACFLLPRTWESSTIILVEEEKIINPLIQNLAVSTTAIQRMQSIRETILSWNSLVELTKKLKLAEKIQTQVEFESLIMNLRENIIVQMRQPNIIKIAYRGANPGETQLITKTLTDILVEKNMQSQTKETDVAINFIKEQLAIYKRKIKESEISKLEDQLKSLLSDSTEQHPLVKELRGRINIARKELDSGEYEVKAGEQPINNPTREALKEELDKLVSKEIAYASNQTTSIKNTEGDPNDSIYKLLLMDKVDSALARDMNVNENIYNMLLQKLETAKITQRLETSKEGTRYTILDPPRFPLKPVKPQKILVIIMGLFLGLAAGVGLVFGSEFIDQSILDIEEAKHILQLPILGAISRITTKEEIEQETKKRKTILISGIGVSFVLIIITMLVSLLKR